jgi:hypothetical protein
MVRGSVAGGLGVEKETDFESEVSAGGVEVETERGEGGGRAVVEERMLGGVDIGLGTRSSSLRRRFALREVRKAVGG